MFALDSKTLERNNMRTLLLTTAAVSFLCFNMSAHALNETCYSTQRNHETGELEDGARKPIHIDAKRPDRGKVSEPATYDASASTTPSGSVEYLWEPRSGGFTISPTNTAVTTVTPDASAPRGVNAHTRLTIRDPVCDFQESTEINVSYGAE